jgi:ABC-2 type transport system ATP-binding protein
VKIYDDGKQALNGLNLNMYNNEIFALLGHNGAGKSTLISILCGLYEATEGRDLYLLRNCKLSRIKHPRQYGSI